MLFREKWESLLVFSLIYCNFRLYMDIVMSKITVAPTSLKDVLLITPTVFGDDRGYFMETFKAESYQKAGIEYSFVQDNASRSKQHILRGLHYQWPNPQGKLVSVVRGIIFDVAVDIRTDSPQFGQWYGTLLDDKEHRQLWIPPGFAHGFVVISDVVDFRYKCTEYYMPEYDKAIAWNDPVIEVAWPIEGAPQLSAKDEAAPFLRDVSEEDLPRINPHK